MPIASEELCKDATFEVFSDVDSKSLITLPTCPSFEEPAMTPSELNSVNILTRSCSYEMFIRAFSFISSVYVFAISVICEAKYPIISLNSRTFALIISNDLSISTRSAHFQSCCATNHSFCFIHLLSRINRYCGY